MKKLALVMLGVCVGGAAAHAGPVSDALAAPVEAGFARLAAAKRDRVFHATGTAYRATMRGRDGGERPAIVRLSRGGATAADPSKSDLLGMAVKVSMPDGRDQDFLLISARAPFGLGARIPRFERTFAARTFSSLTSFRAHELTGPITTQLPSTFGTPGEVGEGGAPAQRASFQLILQRPAGLFRDAASAEVGGEVTVRFDQPLTAEESAALRFTPWHNGGGVDPVGFINHLRRPAYLGSQRGRGALP